MRTHIVVISAVLLISACAIGSLQHENRQILDCLETVSDMLTKGNLAGSSHHFWSQCSLNVKGGADARSIMATIIDRTYSADPSNQDIFDRILQFLQLPETTVELQGVGLLQLYQSMERHHKIFGDHTSSVFALASSLKSQMFPDGKGNYTWDKSSMPFHHALLESLPSVVRTLVFRNEVAFVSYGIPGKGKLYLYANREKYDAQRRQVKWASNWGPGPRFFTIENGYRNRTYRIKNSHFKHYMYYPKHKVNKKNGHVFLWNPGGPVSNGDWRFVAENNDAITIWSDCNHECGNPDNKPIYPYKHKYEYICQWLPGNVDLPNILWQTEYRK